MSRWRECRSGRYMTEERARIADLADAWAEAIWAISDPALADWIAEALQPTLVAMFAEETVH